MNNEISGFFISFTDEEMSDIRRRLELFGYKPDGDGLKKLVTETLCEMEVGGEDEEFESPTDRLIGALHNHLEKNPHHVLMGMAAIKGLGNLLKKKK
jgi:hypothetical protein